MYAHVLVFTKRNTGKIMQKFIILSPPLEVTFKQQSFVSGAVGSEVGEKGYSGGNRPWPPPEV